MSLNEQDVARIARLARIALTPEQLGPAREELDGILHLIERLQAVDTQGVEPLAHPLSAHEDIALRLREDARRPRPPPKRAAQRADVQRPDAADGLFLVPKVIE